MIANRKDQMMSLCAVLIAIFLGTLYIYFTQNLNYWKIRNVPHKRPIPFFGNLWDVLTDRNSPGKYIARLAREFEGSYFGFFALHTPFLIIQDPILIKRVLVSDFSKFENRLFASDVDPILTKGLNAIKAPNWKPLRAKLSPVFTSGKIKLMLHLAKECAGNLRDHILTNSTDKSIEIKETVTKYTTDALASCIFGINANSFINQNSEFFIAGRKLVNRSFIGGVKAVSYILAPTLVKLFKFRFIPEEVVDVLGTAFIEAIEERQKTKIKRNDLIDILIDLKQLETKDGFQFDRTGLIAQAMIFFGAGHETTSSAIAFSLYELALHPKMQTRLRQEILDAVEYYGDITYEAIQDMKYLHMVISETLRKYPLTPFIHRECLENYEIPETGLVIEKGKPVLISQHALHWNPKYYPNPEIYDPERFNGKTKLTPYAYLPFGEGPRGCIGERFALIVAKLGMIYVVMNFLIQKNGLTQDPLILGRSILTNARDGIHLTLQKL